MPWLPCQFIDDHFEINAEGHRETKHEHRDAGLQFGQAGDSPVHSQLITFLITGKCYSTFSFSDLKEKPGVIQYIVDFFQVTQCHG